jgi:hypothetical protein
MSILSAEAIFLFIRGMHLLSISRIKHFIEFVKAIYIYPYIEFRNRKSALHTLQPKMYVEAKARLPAKLSQTEKCVTRVCWT